MVDFIEPSSKARGFGINKSKYDFDWAGLPVDKSFAVAVELIKLATLRSMASTKGKQLNRVFRVIDHGEAGYEVYRAPDKEIRSEAATTARRGFALSSDNPKPVGDGSTAPVGWPLPDKSE